MALSAEQVSRVTGVSMRQLQYWDETGLFGPTHAREHARQLFGRVYSFRDLVGLRVLGLLRNRYHVPLQTLRRVDEFLRRHYDCPWSELRFYVRGKDVLFEDPGTQDVYTGREGQMAIPVEMEVVANETRSELDRLREREPTEIGQVQRHRYVVHNTPVLAGTRIPTTAIWEFREAGYTPDEILQQYPTLTSEDVLAALRFEEERRRQRAAG